MVDKKSIINQTEITVEIDIAGIVAFNINLGMGGEWGYYSDPFDAGQFMSITTAFGDSSSVIQIPRLFPDREAKMEVIPVGNENNTFIFEIDHIRLSMIGEANFMRSTPRHAWAQIFDLDKTDGAIGLHGHFYLGQSSEANNFKMITSERVGDMSCNIAYSIKFSIQLGDHIKYCTIDPLLKTSSYQNPPLNK